MAAMPASVAFLQKAEQLTRTTKLSKFELNAKEKSHGYPIQLTFVLYSGGKSPRYKREPRCSVSNQQKLNKLGATPGKLALVAVLVVVLVSGDREAVAEKCSCQCRGFPSHSEAIQCEKR